MRLAEKHRTLLSALIFPMRGFLGQDAQATLPLAAQNPAR